MNNKSRLSLLVVQILMVSLMAALFGRLFYLQVAAGPKYRDAALSIQSRDVVAPATRGLIVDGYGVPLAMNKAGLAITIDRIAIDKLEDKGVGVMQRLAKLLKLQYKDIYQNTRLCGELPKGQKAGCWQGSRYQPIPITKSADPDIALQIVERSDSFPGVDAQPIAIRSYPSYLDVNAAHVLGYVGPLTENDLLKGNGKQYFRSETIGKTGLEIQYDSFLRGEPGIRTVIVDRKESVTRESQNTKPVAGDHLVTSLDVRLQASAEKALPGGVTEATVLDLTPALKDSGKTASAQPASEQSSIRVSVERVDQLINLVGELVITQSMLAQTAQLGQVTDEPIDFERLQERLQQLERNTRELQESVMSIRMLPVSSVFNRFPRLVRDLAAAQGKQINPCLRCITDAGNNHCCKKEGE